MDYAYRVTPKQHVQLSQYDPADTRGLSHTDGDKQLEEANRQLTALQEVHYAAARDAILIVLQGLDTAGKDGTIRHVMAQFNPASCRVEAFKFPTAEERAHDFLWRIHRVTPPIGNITIFNRSHYEDVVAVRVQKLAPREVWEGRYAHINHFESLLADSRTLILKFFLHISKEKQRERLLERAQDKDKAWKLSVSDWPTHALYDRYIEAYEDVLTRCSTTYAPWYIVPADHRWFRNLAVARTILDVLEPYRKQWQHAVEERSRAALAALAAQQQVGNAP